MLLSVMECIGESFDRFLIHFKHSEHSLELPLYSNSFNALTLMLTQTNSKMGAPSMAKKLAAHRCDSPSMANGWATLGSQSEMVCNVP